MQHNRQTPPDGGPAFPTLYFNEESGAHGMSLRDYFAAHAPFSVGSVRLKDCMAYLGITESQYQEDPLNWRLSCLSKMRFAYADAMLKAREAQS